MGEMTVQKYLGRRMNPEYVALWEAYLDEGYHYKAVGEIFGVHGTTVAHHYPGRGWSHEQVVELGTTMKHHNARLRKIAPQVSNVTALPARKEKVMECEHEYVSNQGVCEDCGHVIENWEPTDNQIPGVYEIGKAA